MRFFFLFKRDVRSAEIIFAKKLATSAVAVGIGLKSERRREAVGFVAHFSPEPLMRLSAQCQLAKMGARTMRMRLENGCFGDSQPASRRFDGK